MAAVKWSQVCNSAQLAISFDDPIFSCEFVLKIDWRIIPNWRNVWNYKVKIEVVAV